MALSRRSWTPDLGLTQELEDQFERAVASYQANPHLIAEHANHEESIRVGGYANRTLLELVQNAADAMSGIDEAQQSTSGRIEVVLDMDNHVLYCANTGRPFSRSGITAITHAHLSGKRGDEIGRFGLGFKSVLAISDTPQVFSKSVSFEFNSARARASLANIDRSARRQPALRLATVIDSDKAFTEDPILSDLAGWATTIVKLPNISNPKRLHREITEFQSEFLLFVEDVRQIKLKVTGEETFETSHTSRDFGGGVFKIERPDGTGDEWIVENRMHRPSSEARKNVGEAVSRSEVKITVAIPKRQTRQRLGRFWSYFPLQDQTSASALFNAPWSVNDDRTTLLRNSYNREILLTLSQMFVKILPRASSEDDPAAHFDYMPARGREALSFGDELLCAHVPQESVSADLIPDSTGELRHAKDLRPLDLTVSVDSKVHQSWASSPNTGKNIPHWRCYTSQQRVTRLRQLFIVANSADGLTGEEIDVRRTLEAIPKRGLLSWLREWADGDDIGSTANAFRFVCTKRDLPNIESAKVIPTTGGMRTLSDKDSVFLHSEDGVSVEGSTFVSPDFLAQPGVEAALRGAGFRDLDPLAILNARLAGLSGTSGDDELSKIWESVLDVPTAAAVRALKSFSTAVKVPTLDGGWEWPRRVFDVNYPLGEELASKILDHKRCVPGIARELGVVYEPVGHYPIEDEPFQDQYEAWVLETLNARLGPGERPIERIDLDPGIGPGPFSMLFFLRDTEAPEAARLLWTVGLLKHRGPQWTVEDLDTGKTYRIWSPVRWAVHFAGLLQSTRGILGASEVVAPSLVRYESLLPLLRGPGTIADDLELPDKLDAVPVPVLEKALQEELYPPNIPDDVLVDFIILSCRLAYSHSHPPKIPSRIKRMIEARPPGSVYLATTSEQQQFLSARERPYLRVSDDEASELVTSVGCRRFEDSFAFSIVLEGLQEGERVVDVFPGLRGTHVAADVDRATLSMAIQITKRVTTEDGVEDQSLESHLDGLSLVVRSDTHQNRLLNLVNEAFKLHLTNRELDGIRKTSLDQKLEKLQQQASAAQTDSAKLDVYFGADDLRDALPKGLWQALEVQGLVTEETSVSELFLTVYGTDSVKLLADLFRQEGFPDVPTAWAGGASTISWLRRMGFGAAYAGRPNVRQDAEEVIPGAVKLNDLHAFQKGISRQLRDILTLREPNGHHLKAMVELPTGAGKTRVATETTLRLFMEGIIRGPVLWIAQSQELCEQAVHTWSMVWRGLQDERPLTIGRLWESNTITEPDTDLSVIVATDAKLDKLIGNPDYDWLSTPTAVFIDEGHRAGNSERYTRILSWLGVAGRGWSRPLVGLSATPFKGKSASATAALVNRFGKRKIEAFQGGDAYKQLADIGVLARVQHEVLPGIEVTLGPDELAEAKNNRRVSHTVLNRIGRDQLRMEILANHIIGLDRSWPTLVFTPNVLSAQVLAAILRYRSIKAAAVSGQTGRQERRDLIQKFKSGELQVLANCDLLSQGFDAPGVRALYIARPTFSPNAYIQMAGRGLRGPKNGGKDECLIVDLADNFGDVTELLGYREYEELWQEQGG